MKKKEFIALALVFAISLPAAASTESNDSNLGIPALDPDSPYALKNRPEERRNLFWPPILSLLIPGFDQWWEDQYLYGAIYSGITVASYTTFALVQSSSLGYSGDDDAARFRTWAGQTAFAVGGVSMYHSFRSGIRSRYKSGQYDFLAHHEETPLDLLKAPIQFKYFLEPSTYLHLAVGIGLNALLVAIANERLRNFTVSDGLTTVGISLNAAVGEEAIFRGYLYPALYEGNRNFFWSNTLQALVFGAVHYSEKNPVPVFQTLSGWYYGWVTERNGWTLEEAIFNHFWWDVIALTTAFAFSDTVPGAQVQIPIYF